MLSANLHGTRERTQEMRARTSRRPALEAARLLVVNEDGAKLAGFADALTSRDLLVINDAATLPASMQVMMFGALPGELRLTEAPVRTAAGRAHLTVVLFGPGDHLTPTERRLPPPRVPVGGMVTFHSVTFRVVSVNERTPRLLTLETLEPFEAFVSALYRYGRPIQYAYVPEALHLWDTQTTFARAPLAVEAPSATYLLPRNLPCDAVFLTHAAGLSDTGDAILNAQLPFPERYDIPERTLIAIESVKARGGRIVAVGTSVTRALESAARRIRTSADDARLFSPGAALSTLRIDGDTTLRVVDGIVTGVHEEHTSHRSLLAAFLPPPALDVAYARSVDLGFYSHEFGDGWLVLPARRSSQT